MATHLLFIKQVTYRVEVVKRYIFSELLLSLSQPPDLLLHCLLVVKATDDN